MRAEKTYPFRLKPSDFFSFRALLFMYIPVVVEQLLIALLGLVDTLLASYLSDEATAAVSYVITINNWVTTFFSSMAAGGSVLTSQYIGRQNMKQASAAARMSLLANCALAVVFCGVLLTNRAGCLQLLLGKMEPEILTYAVDYFTFMIPSYFFYTIVYVSTASLRAQGNTKIPMVLSVILMGSGVLLKYAFSRWLNLGVGGFSLATLIASLATAALSVFFLLHGKKPVKVFGRDENGRFFDFSMAIHSLKVSIPVAVDNSLYQLGVILLARLLVTYGVVHSAANGIATQLSPLQYVAGSSWGLVGLVAVSRAVGAGDLPQAKRYFRVVAVMSYSIVLVFNVAGILFSEQLVRLFGGSEETYRIAAQMVRIYSYFAIPFYMVSFPLAELLRGAGDTNFTMWVSIFAMFVVRIGFGYVLGTICGLGAVGLYIAMGINWVVRAGCFVWRYFSGKWQNKQVI